MRLREKNNGWDREEGKYQWEEKGREVDLWKVFSKWGKVWEVFIAKKEIM